jgi:hypothetical protein
MTRLLSFIFSAASLLVIATPAGAATDVRSQGAVGDAKADDTAAIQKAIDAGAGAVHFPKGIYRLTKTVVIDLDKVGFTALVGDGTSRVVMEGAGPAFKFIGTHGGTAAPDSFKPNVWERQRTPMVDALEIVGAHPEADAIEATGTMQITITRTVIREARHGIHLTVRNRNVLIDACHIYHNKGIGVFLDDIDLHQINIGNSHISYNAQGGVVSLKGNVRNLHIAGCDIEGNMSPDTPPTANVLIDCRGSRHGTAEVAITGCTIQHNSKSPDSANIRIIGAGDPAPPQPAARWGHVTITGNVFSDVRGNIHLQNARGVTLNGNTFWMGYDYDLLVEDSSNVVVGPNNFDRNPGYAYGNSLEAKGGIIFRNSRDCTLNGLHVNGIERQEAAVRIEACDRFNLTGLTILDSDGAGLLLKDVTRSKVSDCLIRDDRATPKATASIKLTGGKSNVVTNNALGQPAEIDSTSAAAKDNTVLGK